MMQRCRQIVVVADNRKLTTDQFNYWSPLPPRWRLITDDNADQDALEKLRDTGADMKDKYKETSQGGLALNVVEC